MDSARMAKRVNQGKVSLVYRRGIDELPARKEEVHHAKAEGIEFNLLCNPTLCLATISTASSASSASAWSSANRMTPAVASRCRKKAASLFFDCDAVDCRDRQFAESDSDQSHSRSRTHQMGHDQN